MVVTSAVHIRIPISLLDESVYVFTALYTGGINCPLPELSTEIFTGPVPVG